MRDIFFEFYKAEEKDIKQIWSEAIFVVDANVLLNLYRFPANARNEFLRILDAISEQIWIPHQFALEYQRNRLNTISDQITAYDAISKALSEIQKSSESLLATYERHPFLKADSISKKVKKGFLEANNEIKKIKDKHPDWFKKDPIRDEITRLFAGRVGSEYPSNTYEEKCKEADDRYAKEIPPGYKDIKKDKKDAAKKRKYGDYIGWQQIIDKAKKDKLPIVLISDEKKEDWWWEVKGKTISPRHELIREIYSKAGVSFLMYSTEKFMEHARPKYKINPKAIKEVKEISKKIREEEASCEQISDSAIEEIKYTISPSIATGSDTNIGTVGSSHQNDEIESGLKEENGIMK